MTRFSFLRSAVFAALILFLGCASQAPPSGGPPDKTPPFVVRTFPEKGALSVALETEIEVEFSEPMDRKSVERSVFLSPRLNVEPRFKWKGRRLRILPGDALAENRTYRISVGAEGRDVYRNKLTSSFDFVFSTGDSIHQGELNGYVRGGSGQPLLVVGFDLSEEEMPSPVDRAPYVTQAGELGDFKIPGLAPGRFRVFAFEDQDGDQEYDAGAEPLAVAVEDADLRSLREISLRDLKLAARDTVAPRPVSARTIDSRRIRIKMDEPVRLPLFVGLSYKGSDLSVDGMYHDPVDSSVVYVVTDPQREGVPYSLKVRDATDAMGNVSKRDTTFSVKGDGREDSRPPELIKRLPREGGTILPRSSIVLSFDEGMTQDPVVEAWAVSDSTVAPEGTWSWLSRNQIAFHPDSGLPLGEVHLRLKAGRFHDLSGNTLGQDVIMLYTVMDVLDLGVVVGSVRVQNRDVQIEARRLDTEDGPVRLRISPGDSTFLLEGLVPGKHAIQGFIDRNGDGKWFSGYWDPYAPAEPILSRVDTIDVRTRWETVIETPFSDAAEDSLQTREE